MKKFKYFAKEQEDLKDFEEDLISETQSDKEVENEIKKEEKKQWKL